MSRHRCRPDGWRSPASALGVAARVGIHRDRKPGEGGSSPPAALASIIEKARILEPMLVRWLSRRSTDLGPILLEGEGIEPTLPQQLVPSLPSVGAVFIVELEEHRIHATLEHRSSSFRRLSEQQKGPWETLADRIRAGLAGRRAP
jgi:hypothetical protein